MRIILDEATASGWACYTQPEEYEPNKLVAVGATAMEALKASRLTSELPTPFVYRSIEDWARDIVSIDPNSDSPRKINMIKLLRSITGCGLKEAKDAIERYL